MQFGAGSTVTVRMRSPDEPSVVGVVDASGNLVIGTDVYEYHAGPPEDYRRQDPGPPPGDWHTYEFDAAGGVKRFVYPKETMRRINTGRGTWTAVG